jgi:hypothetical protein
MFMPGTTHLQPFLTWQCFMKTEDTGTPDDGNDDYWGWV